MKQLLKVLVTIALASLATASFGATDTLFSSGVAKLTEILTGTGGILITLVTILTAVVLGATGNIKSALAALGVAILASVGPSVANSFFTAVL